MQSKSQLFQAKPNVLAFGLTDPGCVRPRNEDAFMIDHQLGLYAVADGLGGHNRGDIAANLVVQLLPVLIRRHLDAAPSLQPTITEYADVLCTSMMELNQHIFLSGRENEGLNDMGTTLVAVWLAGDQAVIAHLGDSRAYLHRNGQQIQLTADHSIVGLLVNHGEITPQEAEDHPAKGRLTRYVGMMDPVDPDIQILETHPDDKIMLCTDGLWGMVNGEIIMNLLDSHATPEASCRALIDVGRLAGGHDNLTAVVIEV